MYQYDSELAGQFQLFIRAFSDTPLDSVLSAIEEGFARFEQEGISQTDLDRIKAKQESQFYNQLSSVLGKGFQLAQYNIFAGDPAFIEQDINNILAVTTEDVSQAYYQFIKAKPYVATSFVPKGSANLVLTGSEEAEVVEEPIIPGAEESFDASATASYAPTPSSFDRSVEPPYGESPETAVPDVWVTTLDNGMEIYGLSNDEVPLVQFNMVISGGQLLESIDKPGVTNLLSQLMIRGTKNKSPKELEAAIEQLGASISISATRENIRISGNALSRNYEQTISLVTEMILEPRWDQEEFELVQQSTISQIKQQEANPNAIAQNTFNLLLYGQRDIRSANLLGTLKSVEEITVGDLKNHYDRFLSPTVSTLHIVGDISHEMAVKSLSDLNDHWEAKQVAIPSFEDPQAPDQSMVYFYDVPDAKQSVIAIGYPALAESDPDFYPASIMNYRLGGGGFASQLTQELREAKGFTYGVRSRFEGTTAPGAFTISSGVRTNVTLESMLLVKQILADYGSGFNESDLEVTKSFMIKSNARALETSGAKLSMLEDMSRYGWNKSYLKDREQIVRDITVEDIRELSEQYLNTDQMIWLVVGDAKTQLDRLEELGFGKPILINEMSPPEQ